MELLPPGGPENTGTFQYWVRLIVFVSACISFFAMIAAPAFLAMRYELYALFALRQDQTSKPQTNNATANVSTVLNLVAIIFARLAAVFVLTLVLSQFSIVVLRYFFSVGSIALQELVVYFHALIFMLGASFGFASNTHVRLDVLYNTMKPRMRTVIDLIGDACLLIPFAITVLVTGYFYVARAWRTTESSVEVSGLQYVYLLKTVILLFAILLLVQVSRRILSATTTILGATPPTAVKIEPDDHD